MDCSMPRSALVVGASGIVGNNLASHLDARHRLLGQPFVRACFSLARAWKKATWAANIGIAGSFIVGIALLVIDPDRFTTCPADMMMFRGGGRLDRRRCNQRRAENYNKHISHFNLRNTGRPFPKPLMSFCATVDHGAAPAQFNFEDEAGWGHSLLNWGCQRSIRCSSQTRPLGNTIDTSNCANRR
jgi:hypothetical protein